MLPPWFNHVVGGIPVVLVRCGLLSSLYTAHYRSNTYLQLRCLTSINVANTGGYQGQ